MASTSYKNNLSVGGPNLDKAKLQLRRPTPDSDVLASSDEDREHTRPVVRPTAGGYPGGRRPSSGWLHDIQPNRKLSLPSATLASSQPTTPSHEQPHSRPVAASSFPWNTNSFSSAQAGSRLKEVIPSPTSAFAPHDKPLPSPTTIESDDGINFLLNQNNPIRKSVRSQSYIIGQGDIENSPVGKFSAHLRSNLRHRPSKPSLLGESALGLAQLREDEVDEVESSNGSEHGVRLPSGYWEREHKQALLKQAAVENARTRNKTMPAAPPAPPQRRKTTAGFRNADYAIEELDDLDPAMGSLPDLGLARRYSEHVSMHHHAPEHDDGHAMKQQWATDNISAIGADALGRRHSFAHYSSFNPGLPLSTLSNTQEEDEEHVSPRQETKPTEQLEQFDAKAYFSGYGPGTRAMNASAISAAHPDPVPANVKSGMPPANPYAVPPVLGRPGRRLFVVTFKCSRAEIYYLYDNTGLEIRCGDLVIVEGDRGCDLGQVAHADVSLDDAKKFKAEANEEHYRWLVMFSQYSIAGSAESSMLGSLARANGYPTNMARVQGQGIAAAQQEQETKPKMIKRLAQAHEISALRDKEGGEAKAKRLGAQKAADHKLPMEILDAEYQADYHKLTYFYYAEAYVNFNELVTDLFKQYKVRIWMSAVNPASVVNPAGMMQVPPPSAIGPGAILQSNTGNGSLSVGPGFGNGNSRNMEQYGRGRQSPAPTNFNTGYYAYSHQMPAYNPQPAYNLPPWGAGQQIPQNMYNTFPVQAGAAGAFPEANASVSPMNYGAWYPPSTYDTTSGYGATTSGFRGTAQPYAASNRPAFGQFGNAAQGMAASYGNPGFTSNPSSVPAGFGGANDVGNDVHLAHAMGKMAFGK